MAKEGAPLSILADHIRLITTDFSKSQHPWSPGNKSILLGGTAIFYLLPILFIPPSTLTLRLFRAAWAIQTVLVFTADYVLASPEPNPLHGLDRLWATAMVCLMARITYCHHGFATMVLGAALPVWLIYEAKVATENMDWEGSSTYQTAWHIIGPVIACAVLSTIKSDPRTLFWPCHPKGRAGRGRE